MTRRRETYGQAHEVMELLRLVGTGLFWGACGSVAGLYLGLHSLDPLDPGDGPGMLSAGMLGSFGSAIGLLMGPVAMACVPTRSPRRLERFSIGVLTTLGLYAVLEFLSYVTLA